MKKNFVQSNVDESIKQEIYESYKQKIHSYQKNISLVKEIEWTWKSGKTTTKIFYDDGRIEDRKNDIEPPTYACHDVAHFIAALNGNMEWDYLQEINHICEYNAVAIEHFLTTICHNRRYNIVSNLNEQMEEYFNQMKWFSEEYYFISKRHPSRKTYVELLTDFLELFDLKKCSYYFKIFYEVYCIEASIKSPNFDLHVNMSAEVDEADEDAYNIMIKQKEVLQNLLIKCTQN